MKSTKPWIVGPEHEMPARRDGTCFWCQTIIGMEHRPDCVVRKRTVIVELKFTVVKEVPEDWTKQDIEFHMNDSSWCASNAISALERKYGGMSPCACNVFEGTYLGEAQEQDEKDNIDAKEEPNAE